MRALLRTALLAALAAAPLHVASAQQNAAAQQRAMLAGACGASFRQTVQMMMGGRLSGQQATQCWCYFWEKAGSNPITMYKGQRAADFCPRYLVKAEPPVPAQGTRTVDVVPQGNQGGNAPGTNPRGDWVPPGGFEKVVPGTPPTTTTQRPPEPKTPVVGPPTGTPQTPSTVERPAPDGTTPTTADRQPPAGGGNNPPPGAHGRHAGGTPHGDGKPTNDKLVSQEPDECPQRGKGCVALIIDFSYGFKEKGEDDLEAISKTLRNVGCDDVDYVAPQFLSTTGLNSRYSHGKKVRAEQQNASEFAKIVKAIAAHRKRVTQGAELAIEIIKGHGGPGGMCGLVVPGFDKDWPADIDRADFHSNNYKAVYKNTCAWFVADFSCFSGLTPEVVDELSNNGVAQGPKCAQMPAENCANHAAYEHDIAVGSSASTTTCSRFTSEALNALIKNEIDSDAELNQANKRDGRPYVQKSIAQMLFDAVKDMPSVYSDRGRKYCQPLRRDNYWLNWQQKKPSCSGGSCR